MNIELTLHEIRVIGCLIEKEVTTPEQYPLSLNALTNACNQRSNRDPVMNLDDVQVQQVVDDLIRKFQVNEQAGFGSRVPKFQHRFCNSNYGALKFSAQELGILCELFLRGPQTPGELRSNARRLCPFGEVAEVEAVLTRLAGREDGPFVRRLPREPGKRESRYTHLFGAATHADDGASDRAAAEGTASATASAAAEALSSDRLIQLELRVKTLEAELAALRQLVDDLTAP